MIIAVSPPREATAAEGGSGIYLLGFRGSLAGFLPPPGAYFQSDTFYYHGEANASRSGTVSTANFDIAGKLVSGIEADIFLELMTATLVTDKKIFGGNIALSALVPVGWIDVGANVGIGIAGPNNTFTATAAASDDLIGLADILLNGVVGWHAGMWHWNVALGLLVPVGDYKVGRLANLGKNHWALDLTTPITWLNPKTGLEVTVAPGITFNAENSDTNYTSGDEFHVEFAVTQSLSPKFAVGITGYHYQQLTGDSGSGAKLGSFKGRTTGVGPNLKFNFNFRGVPVSANARWIHEFNTKRRLEGDVGILTIAFPLGARK